MVAHIEIVSKEMIKPSSPTPPELQNHKLYLLDQIAPPIYTSLIIYYEAEFTNNTTRAEKSQQLKQSLSKTLTSFYPVAGRVNRNLTVDCNDAGAELVEAHVHAQLADVVEEPCIEELIQYLARKPHDICGEIPLAVQINFFDCGGIAIGANMSHEVGDGTSFMNFLNAWAATCRGDAEVVKPIFNLSCIPHRDLSATGFSPLLHLTKEKIVTKRFVFDKEKLGKIKEAIASAPGSQVKNPSRVEAISAFIWKHFIERDEAKFKMDNKKTYSAYHAVNVRPRISPPLPENAFGNIYAHANAFSPPEAEKSYHNLAGLLRVAIMEIDNNYVNKMNDEEYILNLLSEGVKLYTKNDIELCGFSSWCRFPVYELDFGWGKPVWVSTRSLPFKNLVIIMGTRCGQGIEAWVNTLEGDEVMLPNDL